MNNLVIKKYVSIDSMSVKVNGQTILSNDTSLDFSEFMRKIYHESGLAYLKFFKMDAASKLGFLTADILLKGEDNNPIESHEKAIILANRSSSLRTDEKYNESIKEIPSPAVFVYTLPNIMIGEICIHHNIKGENTFFIQEKFDIPFMVSYTNILFNTTATKKTIVGWVEVDLSDHYNSFLMDIECSDNQSDENIFSVEFIKQIFRY